jgi:hypothetical protein
MIVAVAEDSMRIERAAIHDCDSGLHELKRALELQIHHALQLFLGRLLKRLQQSPSPCS